MTTSINHRPEGAWAFDEQVTACFDDMLNRSIPQYATMRKLVFDLACHYRKPGSAIVDLGTSRGEALGSLVSQYGATNRFVGVEVSPPMLAAARARFAGYAESKTVSILDLDLRDEYPIDIASVTLAILTLQFTPIEYRQQIVHNVYNHTAKGGAFILVEKILGSSAMLNSEFIDLYLDMKRNNGYGAEEIARKRHALEGVLVPVTARWNEDLLRSAGFRQVDCFWRWCNFAGWIAVKD